MRQTLFLLAILTARVACIAQEPGVERVPIQPEPAVQERFDKIIAALNNSSDPPEDNLEARREIKDLKDSVADKSEIVRQLIPYAAADTDDEVQPLKARMILHLLDLPPNIVIPELAPYLDDDKASPFARDWFRGHDNVDPSKDYRDYISKAENIPPAFAQYLFEKSPNEAFLVFVRAKPKSLLANKLEALRKQNDEKRPGWDQHLPQGSRVEGLPQGRIGRGNGLPWAGPEDVTEKNELLFAEHIISNAIWLRKYQFDHRIPFAMQQATKQLSRLSDHEQWWVRLYVAETMRQNRELRQDEVLEKLSRDRNELVSKVAKEGQTQAAASPRDAIPEALKDAIPGGLVAPRDVHARAMGGGSILVEWSPSVGATSYDVQRRQPDTETEFTTIATDVKETTYTDNTGGKSGTLYEYRVVAKRP